MRHSVVCVHMLHWCWSWWLFALEELILQRVSHHPLHLKHEALPLAALLYCPQSSCISTNTYTHRHTRKQIKDCLQATLFNMLQFGSSAWLLRALSTSYATATALHNTQTQHHSWVWSKVQQTWPFQTNKVEQQRFYKICNHGLIQFLVRIQSSTMGQLSRNSFVVVSRDKYTCFTIAVFKETIKMR